MCITFECDQYKWMISDRIVSGTAFADIRCLNKTAHRARRTTALQTPIWCSDDHSSYDDHSGHGSGNSSHNSSHGNASSSHASDFGSQDSSHMQIPSASSSYQSTHVHDNGRDSQHREQQQHGAEANMDQSSNDSLLDVVNMFDAGDADTVSYQPSSGQSYKQPDRPSNPDFWAYKPVWCQPWSIVASGTAFVAGARWISGGSIIATCIAAAPILVWWYLFLVLVPADFRKYAEDK